MTKRQTKVPRVAAHGTKGCLEKDCAGNGKTADNVTTVAGAGVSGFEHDHTGDTVARGAGKGAAIDETASVATTSRQRVTGGRELQQRKPRGGGGIDMNRSSGRSSAASKANMPP